MFLCNISILMNFYAAYKSRSPSTCMFLHSFQFRIQSLGPRANMEALGRYIYMPGYAAAPTFSTFHYMFIHGTLCDVIYDAESTCEG